SPRPDSSAAEAEPRQVHAAEGDFWTPARWGGSVALGSRRSRLRRRFMSSINSLLSTALSGMNAASTMMDVAASNVANVESTGYKAAGANLVSAADGAGVEVGS